MVVLPDESPGNVDLRYRFVGGKGIVTQVERAAGMDGIRGRLKESELNGGKIVVGICLGNELLSGFFPGMWVDGQYNDWLKVA